MKKINEASTLSALGVSHRDIRQLHDLRYELHHDMEYVPVTTKSEAIAYIKQNHLLVGVAADGRSIGILYGGTWRDKYYEVVVDGKDHTTGSLKDALAFLPGRVTWYRSAEPVAGPRGSEFAKNQNELEEMIYRLASDVERIYGKRLRSEARRYAQEIRRSIGSAVTQDKREKTYGYYGATAMDSLEALKKGYDTLDQIAKSKTPFKTLGKLYRAGWSSNPSGFVGMIASEVSDYHYDEYNPVRAGEWAKENAAAVAKAARFAFSELRKIRDRAFETYHKPRDPIETEPFRLRVREAYERFSKSGEVESLTKKPERK